MPGPSEDVPRWLPPSGLSDDVPRWEPPRPEASSWGQPSREVPRWDPGDVPRWEPPAREASGTGVETEEPAPRAPVARLSSLARPFVWGHRHPWVIAWAGVLLTPAGVLLLRVVDEAGAERYVEPLRWALLALLALVILRAVIFSARRSVARLALGLVAAMGAAGLLLYPVTQITLGRVICPPRAGTNLGVQSAAAAIEAWRRGEQGGAAWREGVPDPAWLEKSATMRLLDFQLVDSGCYERVAPIDASKTWHDFRVTIKEGDRAPLSKVVVVRTAAEDGGWKITKIEGPLP
jgi:hypothetical protein